MSHLSFIAHGLPLATARKSSNKFINIRESASRGEWLFSKLSTSYAQAMFYNSHSGTQRRKNGSDPSSRRHELYLIYSTFCSGCMHVVLSLLIYNIMDNLFFLEYFYRKGQGLWHSSLKITLNWHNIKYCPILKVWTNECELGTDMAAGWRVFHIDYSNHSIICIMWT